MGCRRERVEVGGEGEEQRREGEEQREEGEVKKEKSLFLRDIAVGMLSTLRGIPPHACTCKAALLGLRQF